MKSIQYTPDAADKIRKIRAEIQAMYGAEKAHSVITRLMKSIRGLSENEYKGPSVANMFGVNCEYRYLFIAPNYIFYTVEDACIRIINLYHEKEDFMWQLFGIDTTPQETLDYWDEE